MFRDIGIEELLVVLVICLLVFGASKLPQIGKDLGKAVRTFREAISGEQDKPVEKINAGKAEGVSMVVEKDKESN
jgi:sec-independent protein translocase protein TatA